MEGGGDPLGGGDRGWRAVGRPPAAAILRAVATAGGGTGGERPNCFPNDEAHIVDYSKAHY